jgi:TP901 family phage tail tape measure protein
MAQDMLAVTIKAFDEYTQTFNKYIQSLQRTEHAQDQLARKTGEAGQKTEEFRQKTQKAKDGINEFYGVLGSLGVIYVFQKAITDIIQTYRNFEIALRQTQVIIGDMSDTLQQMAMSATSSLYGPTQLAQMYRELGAAGLGTQDVLAATPAIMDFATAAMIDQVEASQAVIAAAQSFKIPFTEARHITDVFAEAMNRTTLAGQDFIWALGSIGPVAGLANQSLEQALAAVALLKNAGAKAQDAATSVRSAVLALISPSTQAKDLMEQYGIAVYGAGGKMLQWGDIVAQFEKNLSGLTDAQRNQVLATIFGSDGIRAMAISMQAGSKQVNELARDFSEAEGTTAQFAAVMGETLDGAFKRLQGNIERAGNAFMEDLNPAMINSLDIANMFFVGLAKVDPAVRQLIILLAGAGGLAMALMAVRQAVMIALPAIQAFGIATGLAMGPVSALITLLGTAISGYVLYTGAKKMAAEESYQEAQATITLSEQYEKLRTKLTETKEGTEEHKLLQERMQQLMNDIGRAMPEVVAQWDSYGNAIALNNELLKENIKLANEAIRANLIEQKASYEKQLKDIEFDRYMAERQREGAKKELSKWGAAEPPSWDILGRFLKGKYDREIKDAVSELQKLGREKKALESEIERLDKMITGETITSPKPATKPAPTGTGEAGGLTKKGTSILEQAPSDVKNLLIYASQVTGVSAEILAAVAKQESGFKQSARSPAGAIGIMQLMPGTARGLGVDPYNVKENITGGARYLENQLQQFKGDLRLALAAYNAGPGTVQNAINDVVKKFGAPHWEKIEGLLPKETQGYVSTIINMMGKDTGAGAGKLFSITDLLQRKIEISKQMLEPYDIAINKTSESLSLLGTKEQYLSDVIASGRGGLEQTIALEDVRKQKIADLIQHQSILCEQTDAYRLELAELQEDYSRLNRLYESGKIGVEEYNQAGGALKQRIGELNQVIANNERAWWENQRSILAAQEAIKDEAFRQATEMMQHEVNMRRLSVDQQILLLEKLRNAHEWSTRRQWELEERLARLYGERLKEAAKEIEQAYRDQLDAIDAAADATIEKLQGQIDALDKTTKSEVARLQALLDALDEEEKGKDREKASSEHEKKLKELRDQRQYHELRTGKEHQKAIADIDKQIAEEEQGWAEEQDKWARDNRRQEIQDQIDHVQEQADIQKEALLYEIDRIKKSAAEQRKEIEEHYKEVTKITEGGMLDSLSAMAATDPKWFEVGKKLIDTLIQGIKSGDLAGALTEVQRQLESVGYANIAAEQSGKSEQGIGGDANNKKAADPVAIISPGQYEMSGNTAIIWSKVLAELLGVSISWNDATKKVAIGSKEFTPYKVEGGKSYVNVRQVAEALGHEVKWDAETKIIRIYHEGGPVLKDTLAFLQQGEYVLPKDLVNALRQRTYPNSPGVFGEADIDDALAQVISGVNIAWRDSTLKQYATGGPVGETGPAYLHQGEYVLSANLVDMMRQMMPASAAYQRKEGLSEGIIDRAVDRIVKAIERRKGMEIGTLLNVEKINFEDETDIEIFGREIKRQIETLGEA